MIQNEIQIEITLKNETKTAVYFDMAAAILQTRRMAAALYFAVFWGGYHTFYLVARTLACVLHKNKNSIGKNGPTGTCSLEKDLLTKVK